jgi:sec-independent protein translocase protein TatB
MNVFGIGPLEIVFLVIIALIVLGPKDLVKAGRTIGRVLRQVVMSENWRAIQQASREMRNLPNRLMREAGLEDMSKDLPNIATIRKELGVDEMKKDMQQVQKDLLDWTTPPAVTPEPPAPQAGSLTEPASVTGPGSPPADDTPPSSDPDSSSTGTQP